MSSTAALRELEQRCMAMVEVAEAKAAQQRQHLEAEIARLQRLLNDEMKRTVHDLRTCEAALRSTDELLSRVSTEFAVAHAASDGSIRRITEQRASFESVALQRLKAAQAELHEHRQHLKRQTADRLNVAHQELLRSPPVLHAAPGRSRQHWEGLHQSLIEACQSSHSAEAPFFLDAVYVFLSTSIKALMTLGDALYSETKQTIDAWDAQERGILLDEERLILRRNASQIAPPPQLGLISDRAVPDALLRRLVEDREIRHESMMNTLRSTATDMLDASRRHTAASSETFRAAVEMILAAVSPRVASEVTVTDLSAVASTVGRRVFERLVGVTHRANELFRHHLAAVIEAHGRTLQQRPAAVQYKVTVFPPEQCQSEARHRRACVDAYRSHFATNESRLRTEIRALKERVSLLTQELHEARLREAESARILAQRERDIRVLRDCMSHRNKAELILRTEVRQLKYQYSPLSSAAAVRETWLESFLAIHSKFVSEMRSEMTRLIRNVSTTLHAQQQAEVHLEQLYDARLRAAVSELEEDHARKISEMQRRCAAERQMLHDETQLRLQAIRNDRDEEVRAYAAHLEAQYRSKVDALNALYEERVRNDEARLDDTVAFFSGKLAELQRAAREHENELEMRFARRSVGIVEQYEQEAASLKAAVARHEQQVEVDRMKVMTGVETKIYEKTLRVRAMFDQLLKHLQDTVFDYMEAQRNAFEEQRASEHILFSKFIFSSIQAHTESSHQQISKLQALNQQQASDAVQRQAVTVMKIRLEHEVQQRHIEESASARTEKLKEHHMELLRTTQELRCEQDTKFWLDCKQRIEEASRIREEGLTAVHTLMQERYIAVVSDVNKLLSRDFMAAHESFERECRLRQSHLHAWISNFHKVTMHMENLLWMEVSARGAIEKHFFSLVTFTHLMMVEERRTLDYCSILNAELMPEHDKFPPSYIDEMRRGYEARIHEHREQTANMTHDYLTALSAALREQQSFHATFTDVCGARLTACATGIADRIAVYVNSRDWVIQRDLQRIAAMMQQTWGMLEQASPSPATDDRALLEDTAVAFDRSPRRRAPLSPRHSNDTRIAKSPSPVVASNVSLLRRAAPVDSALLEERARLMEYFSDVRALISRTLEEIDRRLGASSLEREQSFNALMRAVHLRYLEASNTTVERLIQQQQLVDERDAALIQLTLKMDTKATAEVRAAVLADDLAAHARRYDAMSRRWMLHAVVDTGNTESPHRRRSAALVKAPIKDGVEEDVAAASRQPAQPNAGQVLFAFVSSISSKRSTRNTVLENIQMRERLIAYEWYNDHLFQQYRNDDDAR